MDIASRKALSRGVICAALLALLACCEQSARAQGAAPETAPPLFPGGTLISYNSVFGTRGIFAAPTGTVPMTARPTFSHEGLFNFTWGFHANFDLTVLVPVVTNRFDMNSLVGRPRLGGTGLGIESRFWLSYRPLAVASDDLKQKFGGIEGLATTLLYDRDGILRKKVLGFEYRNVIESDLKQLF